MDEEFYELREHRDAGRTRDVPSYNLLRPPFMQEPPRMSHKDSFRVHRRRNSFQDSIEDEDAYMPAAPLDSFDERMLNQPWNDRQQQAVQGRARLSFAPDPARSFDNAAALPSQAHYNCRTQPLGSFHHIEPSQHAMREYSDRFAYNRPRADFIESSSDMQTGHSSSPALNAGRTKTQHTTSAINFLGDHLALEQQHLWRPGQPHQNTQPDKLQDVKAEFDEELNDDPTIPTQNQRDVTRPFRPLLDNRRQSTMKDTSAGLPEIQGIRLVPVSTLPGRFRPMFPYPTFNAIQSKSFAEVFQSDDNFVLASPTGSGKTVVLELAVCRAVATHATDQYKVVYQAPTKALCSERQRDWEKKFNQIGLKCAELTGDSNAADLQNVQSANIIITTPEKWDSMTRKWKDHERLVKLIKLFLIDEVHILKEDRGAVLEVVVSRMKSIGTDVRFVALSATVPNLQDVAAWLGRSSTHPEAPAVSERFDEDFRPVKLQKHVCGYVSNSSNDFAFERVLDAKLPEVVAKYSEGKPMMVFCATRASTINTAKLLATWWNARPDKYRFWTAPANSPMMRNKDLRDLVGIGVAFHHAGLDLEDRIHVEKGFLAGHISVICCTSTLAVGVNLPCHLVIIKNTMSYAAGESKEYSDLEMMQMLGRAGRPQFDRNAVAVIMTRQAKARKYEMMLTSQEILESKLHLNLIDHMNAEIGLGTIRNLTTARIWLKGTFLYVRLQQNPSHYKLEGTQAGRDIEQLIDEICTRDITLLRENSLVIGEDSFRCTDFGHAMARHYIHFDTMKVFLGLEPKSTLSEILSALSQATEFANLRFRQGEKAFYKQINQSPSMRFPIPVNLDLPSQKVSIIIQSILGNADVPSDGEMQKHKAQYTTESQVIFRNVNSLIRCIIDCQISLCDSTSIHNALFFERSLGARAWDDSPVQLKQIESIGIVAVRKFVNAGIRCIDDLEACDARRIETLLGRNPPYGLKLLDTVRQFPKLRVSLRMHPSSIAKTSEGVKVQVTADIGFINEKVPISFNKHKVYVCILAETSDGRKAHFARIFGKKLEGAQHLIFTALLTSIDQSINCYVMCDSIAGSMREATIKPKIPPTIFPAPKPPAIDTTRKPNISRRRTETPQVQHKPASTKDDFGDGDIDDDALMEASLNDLDFDHIENFPDPTLHITRKNTLKNKAAQDISCTDPMHDSTNVADTNIEDGHEPIQLANGKWACNHNCKNKNGCKHMCCKNGLDKPPKKKAAKFVPSEEQPPRSQVRPASPGMKASQTKLQLTSSKRKSSAPLDELDLTQEKKKRTELVKQGSKDFRSLYQLHRTTQVKDPPASLYSVRHSKPGYCYSQGGGHDLSFLGQPDDRDTIVSSNYGGTESEDTTREVVKSPAFAAQSSDLPTYYEAPVDAFINDTDTVCHDDRDSLNLENSYLSDAMVGLADSQQLQATSDQNHEAIQILHQDAENMDVNFVSNEDYDMRAEQELASLGFNEHDFEDVIAEFSKDAFQAAMATGERLDTLREGPSEVKIGTSSDTVARKTSESQSQHAPFVQSIAQVDSLSTDAEEIPTRTLATNDAAEGSTGPTIDFKDENVPEAFKDLEPWLFREFGDTVELTED